MANGFGNLQLQPTQSGQTRIALARSLMSQGASAAPVQSITQGLNRLAQGFLGGRLQRIQDERQKERQGEFTSTLQNAFSQDDPQKVAQILMSNQDTAPIGANLLLSQTLQGQKPQAQTITGAEANELYGTDFNPQAAVTVEGAPGQRPVIQKVINPPDAPNKTARNVIMPDGTRVAGRTDDQGNIEIRSQDGGFVPAPRGAQIVGTTIQGTADEVLPKTEQTKLNDLEASTKGYIATTKDALKLLEESPDVNTFVAAGASLVNGLQAEAEALGRQFGTDFDPSDLNPAKYEDTYEELGVQKGRMRSLIQSLAYARARAREPGGRLSEADVRSAIIEVGGKTSDPETFAQVLRDVAKRTARTFRINYEVRLKEPFGGDLGANELDTIGPGVNVGPRRPNNQFEGFEVLRIE